MATHSEAIDHTHDEPKIPPGLSLSRAANISTSTSLRSTNLDDEEHQALYPPNCSIAVHRQIEEELDRREHEISKIKDLILALRNEQKDEDDVERLCTLINQRKVLKAHVDELQELCSELRWYAIGTQSTFRMSDVAMIRLLKIQQETGNSTATLSAFGAALSMSILFSGNRGNMWWFFGAWWCFTFGVVMLGALQILASGTGAGASLATRGNWMARRVALIIIMMSYSGVAMGMALFAIAVINYDVSRERNGGDPHIDGGPSPTRTGKKFPTAMSKLGYAWVAFFFCTFLGAFLYRIAPRLQLRNVHRGVKHYLVRDEESKTSRLEAMLSGTGQV